MEGIIVENLYKEFRIGFKKKQSALARIFSLISGRIPTRKILAINNISFKAHAGEITGIIGKNGSGKSTLLRLISGIYKEDQGKITTNGKIISLINLIVGLKTSLTVKDNTYLIGSLFDLGKKDIEKKFNEITGFAELDQYANTKVSQLSIGMRQRMVFSIAVNANPKILLLDEVFEVGDESFKNKSAKKIKELVKNGVTIVLVSHDLRLIEKYCDRVIWMEKGKIVKQGHNKEVVKEYLKDTNT